MFMEFLGMKQRKSKEEALAQKDFMFLNSIKKVRNYGNQ